MNYICTYLVFQGFQNISYEQFHALLWPRRIESGKFAFFQSNVEQHILFLFSENRTAYFKYRSDLPYRVESFIEHQDACSMGRLRPESQALQPACLSRTASSPSPSSETNFSTGPWHALVMRKPTPPETTFLNPTEGGNSSKNTSYHNLDLQLSTTTNPIDSSVSPKGEDNHSTQLQLSIGSCEFGEKNEPNMTHRESPKKSFTSDKPVVAALKLKDQAREHLRLAMVEKAYAEEARQQAKRQIELAEQEFANAKRLRQQAQAELDKAQVLKDRAIKQVNSTILQITCHACKQQFQARAMAPPDENSLVLSYMSSAITTEGEVENDNRTDLAKSTNP